MAVRSNDTVTVKRGHITSFQTRLLITDRAAPYVMKSMKLASGSYDWFLMWRNSTTIFSFSLSSMTDTVRGEASLARKLP